MSRSRRPVVAAAAVLAIAAAAWLGRDAILRFFIERAVGLATGYSLRIASAHFGSAHGVLFGVTLMRGNDPVLDAQRIDLDYALREIFPGGEHRYGFVGVAVNRPHVYVIRHKDGSFNIAAPGGGSNVPAPTRRAAKPYFFTARVTGGMLDLIDVLNVDPTSRHQRVDGIHGIATVKSDERSRYRFDGALIESGHAYPIRLRSAIDIPRGYALHRFEVPALPLRALGNYLINSDVAQIREGYLRDLDVRLYALGLKPDAPIEYHLGGSARLDGLGMKLAVLTRSVRGIRGELDFADDAIVMPGITGLIGTTPLRGAGGMYDFNDPKFRLAIRAHEDLDVLHRDFDFLKTEPVTGELDARCLMLGPVGNPLILADATGPRVAYGKIPITDFRASIGYHDSMVLAGDVAARVGAIRSRLAGRFLTGGKDPDILIALQADAGPGTMPYLDRFAPHARSQMTLTGAGLGLLLDAHGVFSAAGNGESADGVFALNPHGVGEVGPFSVRQPGGGRLDAAFFMNREHGTSALWANASGLRIFPPQPRAILRGVDLPPFPDLAGRFDGQVAGVDVNTHLILAGSGRTRDALFAGTPISDARADFSGPIERMALAGIDARGEFGRFTGRGAFGSDGFAFDGNLDGTLEGMRRWTGDLGARGRVRGPVAVVSAGDRTLVQSNGAVLENATVQGVPLRRLAGTFAIDPSTIVVYAADVDVAGGHAVAKGDSRNGIAVAASDLSAASLRATGLPISRGSLLGQGEVRLHAGTPSFNGGIALASGALAGHRIDASAELRYENDALRISDGSVALAQLFGFVDGTVSRLSRTPSYDLQARLQSGDLGLISQDFNLPIPYLRGSIEGDIRLGGEGLAPIVAGTVRIPEGSVNGLHFANGRTQIAVDRFGVAADGGSVTIGSTQANFTGLARTGDLGFTLEAAHANLADFNDFFDPADTLAGRGSFRARFGQVGGVTLSGGNVDLAELRVRRLPFGHVVASWESAWGKIDAKVAVDGTGGSLRGSGTIAVPPGSSLAKLATRSQLDLSGTVRGLDLNVWLPALGYTPPILGHIDATGRIRGRYPGLGLDVEGEMTDGVIGRVPLERVHLAAAANGKRTDIRSADLTVAGLELNGSGSFGFGVRDPLVLNLQAHTEHLGEFIHRVFAKSYDVDGAFDARLAMRGTLQHPRADAGFEMQSLRLERLVIPSVIASAAFDGDRVALRDATLYMPVGKITLAGTLPLVTAPLSIGPPTAALSFDLGLRGIALDQFESLAPVGTKLDGLLDGLVGVRGTVRAPRLVGELDLTDGAYSGPFETQPIKAVNATIAFEESSVKLTRFEANVGGGTLRGTGELTLPDLRTISRPVYDVELALNAVRIAVPGYGSARGDGALNLRRGPGDDHGILGGNLAISDASVPLSAFLKAGSAPQSSTFSIAAALAQPPSITQVAAGVFGIPDWLAGIGLDLTLSATNNVRIRSPILDIGGRGTVKIAGRLGDPTLDGRFDATPGGSLFLNRAFRLQEASVRFAPENGISPYLFARAATQVGNLANAPPVDVTVTAQGVIPDVRLSYSSNPPYDEATIVGLLFDASSLGASVGSYNALAPTTNILLPPNAFQQTPSGTFQLSQEATNLINAQFTARLLAPIEQGLGAAFGLSDLSLNLAPSGSFGVQARRLLGRNVSFIYGTSLTYPYRMTFGIESRPSPQTSVIFTVFTQQGVYSFGAVKPDAYLSTNPQLGSAAELGGTQGFTVNIQRLFR